MGQGKVHDDDIGAGTENHYIADSGEKNYEVFRGCYEVINSIMEAISIALNTEFGDGYETYIEEINQDLTEPSFFIQCLNPTNDLFRGEKYFRRNQFCIQYFPQSDNDRNRECYEVLERLNICLEYIDLDGPMRGTQMNGRMVDGILFFFVNYDCFVYRRKEDSHEIGEMVSHTAVKEGD